MREGTARGTITVDLGPVIEGFRRLGEAFRLAGFEAGRCAGDGLAAGMRRKTPARATRGIDSRMLSPHYARRMMARQQRRRR